MGLMVVFPLKMVVFRCWKMAWKVLQKGVAENVEEGVVG